MARVLGRLRLSATSEESTSIARQREHVQDWAGRFGHSICGWAVDNDVSGEVDPFKAPQFGDWLQPERLHEWDIVCAWKGDRLSRNMLHSTILYGYLAQNDKLIEYTHDTAPDLTTVAGRMMATVQAGMAEYELEAIKGRNRDSQRKARMEGRFHGGRPPFGYDAVKREGGGYFLQPNKEQREVVREIFLRVASGTSVSALAKDLNDRGILSPRGKLWTVQTLLRMIRSPCPIGQDSYKGEIVLGGDSMPLQVAEPLVSEDLWKRVNAVLADKGRPRKRNHGTAMLLNVAVCDECESDLYHSAQTVAGKLYRYWRCSGRNKRFNGCSQPSVNAEVVEGYVNDLMVTQGAHNLRTELVLIPGNDNSELLEKKEAAIAKLLELLELGVTGPEFVESMARLTAERDQLAAQPITRARKERRPVHPPETYAEAWARFDAGERRALLLDAGIRVYVRDRQVVRAVTPGAWLRDVVA